MGGAGTPTLENANETPDLKVMRRKLNFKVGQMHISPICSFQQLRTKKNILMCEVGWTGRRGGGKGQLLWIFTYGLDQPVGVVQDSRRHCPCT